MRQALAALLLLGCAGCVHRQLTIATDPPGAMVYVNDQLKGSTPVTYDFEWYGWHRLTLRKNGFERLDDRKELRAPCYLWIPFDLAAELLPFPVRDERTWSYTLTPIQDLPVPQPPSTTITPSLTPSTSTSVAPSQPAATDTPPSVTPPSATGESHDAPR